MTFIKYADTVFLFCTEKNDKTYQIIKTTRGFLFIFFNSCDTLIPGFTLPSFYYIFANKVELLAFRYLICHRSKDVNRFISTAGR